MIKLLNIALLFLLLFSNSTFFAQNDSITSQILKEKNSIRKVDKLNTRSEELWNAGEYATGKYSAEEALKIASVLKYQKGKAYALNNIGIVHDYQGRYAEALSNYFKALTIQKKIKDETGLAYTYNNIGLIYSNQKNYPEALKNYESALKIRKKTGDLQGISSTANNIGIVHMYKKNYTEALDNYFESIRIDSILNNPSGLSDSYSNVGLVYLETKDFSKAEEYFTKSMEIREKIDDKRGIANSCNNIATLYEKQGKYEEAKINLLRGLKIGLEMGAKELIQYSYQMLSEVEEKTSNLNDALKYYKLSIIYSDSIKNDDNTRKQTQTEMQFKFDQQQAEDKLKKQQEDYKNQQQKQFQIFLIIALILITLSTLSFAFFINKKRRTERQQKMLIGEQKLLVEEKNREILDSITYAKRIQSAILPPDRIVKEYLMDSFVLYRPKDIVAGDFYWVEPIGDEILIAVADCTGHGVPGALISVVCHNALNRSVREFNFTDPGDILNKCRELIIEEFIKSDDNVNDGMDISLCRLNLKTLVLNWAGANSPIWLKRSGDQAITELKATKQPIGQFESIKPFESDSISLNPGDSIYLFTDGFADQFGGDYGKKLKSKGLKNLLVSFSHLPMKDQRIEAETFFDLWRATLDQVDDVCMIGIRV